MEEGTLVPAYVPNIQYKMTFKIIKTMHMVRTSNGDAKCTKALSKRIQIFAKNDIEKLNLIVKEYFNFFIGKLYTTHEP